MKTANFYSAFDLDESVILDFGTAGKLTPCYITKVSFIKNKVFYDVMVNMETTEKGFREPEFTKLYQVKSDYVKKYES